MQGLNSIGVHNIFSSSNKNLSKLPGMARNLASKSDNLGICRECLDQSNGKPKEALNTLKNAFRLAGEGSPSRSLKDLLVKESTNKNAKESGLNLEIRVLHKSRGKMSELLL